MQATWIKIKRFLWWICKALVAVALFSFADVVAETLLSGTAIVALSFAIGWLAAWLYLVKMK
jgi:hypothetical protein